MFNDLIKKDIENIELPNKTKKELDLKILEIEKEGLNASYFDYDLIKLLAYFDPKIGKKEVIKNELEKNQKKLLTKKKKLYL